MDIHRCWGCNAIIERGTICDECMEEDSKDKLIAELESRIHKAKEVYAGMEGFEPQTAPEGYLLRIIEQMYQELIAKRLEGE